MKKSISFSAIPYTIVILVVFAFVTLQRQKQQHHMSRVEYYTIEGYNIYFAIHHNNLYLTDVPQRLSDIRMLHAWNTSIKLDRRGEVSIYIPNENPLIVAVHSNSSIGEIHRQWILWLPSDLDTTQMVCLKIQKQLIRSLGARLVRFTPPEIDSGSNLGIRFPSNQAAIEAKNLLCSLNKIDTTITMRIEHENKYRKRIVLSTNDYIQCYGGESTISTYYPYPLFYINNNYPNTVILQNYEPGLTIHCSQVFILQITCLEHNSLTESSFLLNLNETQYLN